MKLQKKGQKGETVTTKPIYEIIVGAVVVLALLTVAVALGTGEAQFKKKITIEPSLLLTELPRYAGDVYLLHPSDYSKYDLRALPGVLGLSEAKEDILATSYRFVPPDKADLAKLDGPEKIVIGKQTGQVYLSTKEKKRGRFQLSTSS